MPLSGWLAARFGAVRVMAIAAAGFGLFSLLCGLAPSLSMLVIFRVLQGFAGGPLMPMSQTLLMRITPPARVQQALGLQTMTTILAPIAGPLIGGSLTDSVGWPWAFYINVPISIFVALMVWSLLRSREVATVKQPIDYVGLGLLMLWIGALQIMLDNGQDKDWFHAPFIVVLAVVAAIGFVAFLIWELTAEHPIVDLSVFRFRTFSVMAIAMAFTMAAFFATIVLIPLWLQTNMNYTATAAGEVMAWQGVLGVMVAPIAAMLVFARRSTLADVVRIGSSRRDHLVAHVVRPEHHLLAAGAAAAAHRYRHAAVLRAADRALGCIRALDANRVRCRTYQLHPHHGRCIGYGTLHHVVGQRHHGRARGRCRPRAGPAIRAEYDAISGLSLQQAVQNLSDMVQSQAVMLATNHVFQLLALTLAAVAAGCGSRRGRKHASPYPPAATEI